MAKGFQVTNIKGVAAAILREVDTLLDKLYNKIKYPVIEITKSTIKNSLKQHPTYISISAGDYNAHFGFYPDTGESRMIAITNAILESLDVNLVREGKYIKLEAFIDYKDVYKIKEAKVFNNSQRGRVGLSEPILDWLEWMLESGGRVTVFDAHISLGDYSNAPFSRSQEAIMIRGGNWSVPSEIAGTISDNWITQSIADAETRITRNLEPLIRTEFNKLNANN